MQPYTPAASGRFDPTGLQKPSKGAGGSHGATIYSGPNGGGSNSPTGRSLSRLRRCCGQPHRADVRRGHSRHLPLRWQGGRTQTPDQRRVRFPVPKTPTPTSSSTPKVQRRRPAHHPEAPCARLAALNRLPPNGLHPLPDGRLAGIDKGQAAKYFRQDRLHWNFRESGTTTRLSRSTTPSIGTSPQGPTDS